MNSICLSKIIKNGIKSDIFIFLISVKKKIYKKSFFFFVKLTIHLFQRIISQQIFQCSSFVFLFFQLSFFDSCCFYPALYWRQYKKNILRISEAKILLLRKLFHQNNVDILWILHPTFLVKRNGITCNSKENCIKVLACSLSYRQINRKFSLYDKQIEKNQLNQKTFW